VLLGGLAALVLAGWIIIRIQHKDGTTTELKVPDDAKVTIEMGGKGTAAVKPKVDATPSEKPQAATPDVPSTTPKALTLDLGGGVTVVLVRIPAGTFEMGSAANDPDAVDGEKPRHPVTLSHSFYLGQTETTVGQFKRFVAETSHRTEAEREGDQHTWKNPGFVQTDHHPVVRVSWNDARTFCEWLSGKTGEKVVLPTEAEWEYGCRAGSTTKFHFGDDDSKLGEYAWFSGNPISSTRPCGQLRANAFGLYDMHGNVWEWCRDGKRAYKSQAESDPVGPMIAGAHRAVRGGSFEVAWQYCRAAYTCSNPPSLRSGTLGFRVSVLRSAEVAKAPRTGEPPPRLAEQVAAAPPTATLTLDLGGSVTLELVRIPAGTFTMGSADGGDDEKPPHTVTIAKPFYLGRTEVTVGQFRRFVEAERYRTQAEADGQGGYGVTADGQWGQRPEFTWTNTGVPQSDDHPVVNVSWNDAVAFCNWLGRTTGRTVALPTEAEWEYACRAGAPTKFSFGGDEARLGEYAWFAGNIGKGPRPCGQKRANVWGLYDMHGNVWEWCRDGQRAYAGQAETDPVGPPAAAGGGVVRGGAFDMDPRLCRAAGRLVRATWSRGNALGFRVSVSP
jgi:formylglycine-generating enzyme required for sulfatase activity